MSGIFDLISNILKIIITIIRGDQPKRSEIENATSGLKTENDKLQKELENEIAKKEKK